jgi:hypothetical protein
MMHEKDGLDELRLWFIARKASFAQAGYKADLVESPADRGKRSVSVTIASDRKIGQLVLWNSGEAELGMADVASGEIAEERREITSDIGLRDATMTLMAWLMSLQRDLHRTLLLSLAGPLESSRMTEPAHDLDIEIQELARRGSRMRYLVSSCRATRT